MTSNPYQPNSVEPPSSRETSSLGSEHEHTSHTKHVAGQPSLVRAIFFAVLKAVLVAAIAITMSYLVSAWAGRIAP